MIQNAQRNSDQFGALYEKYFYEVFMFCFRRVGDKATASDLASQTFLKAMLHLHSYTFTGAPFGAWLMRIASNEVNQLYRQNKRVNEVELSDIHLKRLSEETEITDSDSNREALIEALNQLSLEESQLIELRFFEQCSFAEIAGLYDITEANAKMRVYRILKRMKASIAQSSRS